MAAVELALKIDRPAAAINPQSRCKIATEISPFSQTGATGTADLLQSEAIPLGGWALAWRVVRQKLTRRG